MLSAENMHLALECNLFDRVEEDDMKMALTWLKASVKTYRKGEFVFLIGDKVTRAGIVLAGTTTVSFLDESFNNVGMDRFEAGSLFGGAMSALGGERSAVQMEAATDCRLLLLDLSCVEREAAWDASFKTTIMANLVRDLAQKSVFLNQKLRIMGQRKLRERVRTYLRVQEQLPDGRIQIPFNRTEWAEFLGANRSALSRELSALQREGTLELGKRWVRVLNENFLAA